MSRRMMKTSAGGSGLVVWGWFAVVAISDGKLNGGDLPGGDAAKALDVARRLEIQIEALGDG